MNENNPFTDCKNIKEKRAVLSSLSIEVKLAAKVAEITINQALVAAIYTDDNHSEFKTYKGWKETGKQVKKGAKAFAIWAKPRQVDDPDKQEGEQSSADYSFFPIAHLFSNYQVEELN